MGLELPQVARPLFKPQGSKVQVLYGHYLFVLGGEQVVHALYHAVVNLLKLSLGILLVVLRKAILYGFLELVLHFGAHVAYLHLDALAHLVALLGQFAAALFGALRYGASGYLLKGVSVKELADAVREVVRGGSIIMPGVASKALEMFARMARGSMQIAIDEKQTADLQENEWRVIREVGCGKSNKEIAAALCLSEGTVRNYLSSVLSKLDLRDRTQLAIWAVQSGVTTDPFGGKPWEG